MNLMIIAHPDDEVIFGWEQLQTDSWYVICVTNASNLVRSEEFKQSAKQLNFQYEIWDYPDKWGGSFPDEITDRIKSIYLSKEWDKVVTHNSFGEYGHTQHSDLYYKVKSIVDSNLYVFSCELGSKLSFDSLYNKMYHLKTIYKSQYELGTYDWYDQTRTGNEMMNYIIGDLIREAI
jgi:LmbE family N-acetylglucosaminyl deacetylase